VSEDYARPIDGNGYVPDEAAGYQLPRMCGCCQRHRIKPEDIAMFGRLIDAGGKSWDICGKCISTMWRKRAPKLEPLV